MQLCEATIAMSGFSDWLRHERLKRGWTLEMFADHAGTTHASISRLEHRRAKPSRKMVKRLAAALGADEDSALLAAGFVPDTLEIERVPDADEQEVLAYYSGLEPGGKALAKDLLEALARHGRETESAASIGGRGRRDTTQPGIDESATDGADGAGAPEKGTGRTL